MVDLVKARMQAVKLLMDDRLTGDRFYWARHAHLVSYAEYAMRQPRLAASTPGSIRDMYEPVTAEAAGCSTCTRNGQPTCTRSQDRRTCGQSRRPRDKRSCSSLDDLLPPWTAGQTAATTLARNGGNARVRQHAWRPQYRPATAIYGCMNICVC